MLFPIYEDWYAHQSWCHAQSDAAVQKAMANLRKQAGTCRIAGGPPAPKQAPDPSRHPVCSSYSTYVGQWQAKAKAVGCRIETLPERSMSFPIKQHYDWCMTNSDAEFRQRSPQALGFKAWIEKLCSAQLRRPVKL